MDLIDRTTASPREYRGRLRAVDEVDLAVLHQTGPIYAPNAVRAHFLVEPDGRVLQLHAPLVRLRYGSAGWNARCITIEHSAHYPGRYARGVPIWAKYNARAQTACEPRGRLESYPAQVHASRALLTHLRATMPALRYVAAHRQIESGKGGCPGPDLWREVGEWAISALGLELVATESTGRDLPSTWRQPPSLQDALGATEAGDPSPRYHPTTRPRNAVQGEPSPFTGHPTAPLVGGPAAGRP